MSDISARCPIDALNLPARARNALVQAGITTPEDVATRSDVELLALRGFGPTSLAQVRERLAAWGRERQPDQAAAPEAVPAAGGGQEHDDFPLLPGRRVLHATWLAGPPGRLFLWGEGEPLPPRRGRAPRTPLHPFHVPPAALRDALPGLMIPDTAAETRALARLPVTDHGLQPSPQLIRDYLAEKPGEPESLGLWRVDGLAFPPLEALAFLNDLPRPEDLAPRVALGTGLRFWSLAGKLALELLARQQFAPALVRQNRTFRATWVPVLDQPEDLRRVEQLAQAMPPICRALIPSPPLSPPLGGTKGGDDPPAPRALLKGFLGTIVDTAVRAWAPPLLQVVTRQDDSSLRAWMTALFDEGDDPVMDAPARDLEKLHLEVTRWLEQLLAGAEEPFRLCFRLEPPTLPEPDREEEMPVQHPESLEWHAPPDDWALRFFLQARDDPSLLVPAGLVWRERGSTLRYLDHRFDNPQEKMLAGLGQAARLFLPLEASLRTARPEVCRLDTEQAYTFLREAAPLLEGSGFGVLVPQWWRKRHKRLGVRATISPADGKGVLNLDALVRFRWQLALGDQTLAPEEFVHLAALKLPLVQVRGEWVELQPEQIEAAIRFWEKRAAEEMTLRQALQIGLAEEGEVNDLPIVSVEAQGWVQDLLRRLSGSEPLTELPPPQGLVGQLRPYQVRGFSWLRFLRQWGLGACLADDMGLGKTIQTIALILHDLEEDRAAGPVLVLCPTSVVGNWAREIARFAPSLQVMVHHGSDRASGETFAAQAHQAHMVISTYALARRDEETLREVEWAGVVLDEAQKIKNPAAKQTQAIRRLPAGYRVALTGTPVENRLSELWSISQFLNPGYLGSQRSFRTRFARPIERYQDQEAAARLRKLVQPFTLRRVKTDPTIIQDLPEKLENKVYCTLTPEQATLYQAVVEDAMLQVEEAEGIQRRGLVLSMLLRLKQICNHPAQFLGDRSPLPDRSGKLARLGEMLEEVLSVNERALVFTQFAEMGTLLQTYLQELFGGELLFLYGGTPAKQRDRMIARFQEERPWGPPIFILSLKAGGLGLNLTRANHVFHFDRWWNPAVENQATDRAFRIGQTKDVWVHKFICGGTLEERIDELIESKKALAESIIGAGEAWLTELNTDQLRGLVTLSLEAAGD
ncbi:MAG: ATP-dependent helicase [Anaerolineae bacterium]|nr:ATP-dependent helicase [Anaerolineae bacterium]